MDGQYFLRDNPLAAAHMHITFFVSCFMISWLLGVNQHCLAHGMRIITKSKWFNGDAFYVWKEIYNFVHNSRFEFRVMRKDLIRSNDDTIVIIWPRMISMIKIGQHDYFSNLTYAYTYFNHLIFIFFLILACTQYAAY